jgi:N-acetylglucosaminyldiphosphoundecaprenol N-acetyl-beta-D-mannosaminyltransferase
MLHALATDATISAGARGVLGAALGALGIGVLLGLLGRATAERSPSRRRADWQGVALAVGLVSGACLAGRPEVGGLGWALMAAAVLLVPTDWLTRPRGLRLVVAAIFVVLVSPQGPPIASFKMPFGQETVSLQWLGWAVSWAWIALFGSMFARAGVVAGVAPGLGTLAGLTFWVICALRPEATGPQARFACVLLAGASLGLGPVQRALGLPWCSAGAYAIGMAAGLVAAMGMMKDSAALALLVPLLVVGMPLFSAVGPRARASRTAGRSRHLHEVLLDQGYSATAVAVVALGGTAYLCLLAVLLTVVVEWHWGVKLLILAAWALVGLLAGYTGLRLLPRATGARAEPVRVPLFGLRLDALTMAQALERARRFLRSGMSHYIVTCDAQAVIRAQEDEGFRRIVNEADLVTADGAGVVLAARLLALPVEVRVAGCDLVEGLCRVATEERQGVYFLGAAPGVAEEAARKLAEGVPGLTVVGCGHGYFAAGEEPEVVAEVARARPGVLFVGLGQPRQEQFIAAHLDRLGCRVAIGIGGSLDVISGRKHRAPVWMQRAGLEWAYRVLKEPSRLPRLKALPRSCCGAPGPTAAMSSPRAQPMEVTSHRRPPHASGGRAAASAGGRLDGPGHDTDALRVGDGDRRRRRHLCGAGRRASGAGAARRHRWRRLPARGPGHAGPQGR